MYSCVTCLSRQMLPLSRDGAYLLWPTAYYTYNTVVLTAGTRDKDAADKEG